MSIGFSSGGWFGSGGNSPVSIASHGFYQAQWSTIVIDPPARPLVCSDMAGGSVVAAMSGGSIQSKLTGGSFSAPVSGGNVSSDMAGGFHEFQGGKACPST